MVMDLFLKLEGWLLKIAWHLLCPLGYVHTVLNAFGTPLKHPAQHKSAVAGLFLSKCSLDI
jgi:hypothetical protein